jgi:hypothetical protein
MMKMTNLSPGVLEYPSPGTWKLDSFTEWC